MEAVEALPEDARNRLLRRVDWRMLLTAPAVEEVVHAVREPLDRALGAVGRRTVPLARATRGSASLVVLVDPDPGALRAAVGALAPGGCCYSEWYGIGSGGARGVRRRLEGAGLHPLSVHWPWPRPDGRGPSFWLPLSAPPAVDWFLSSRPRAEGAAEIRRAVTGAAWRLARRADLLRPVCAVAVRPGDGPVPWLTRVARDHIGEEPGLTPVSWLLLTGGRRSINKLVALGFSAEGRRPLLAIKVGRVVEAEESLRHEAASLDALHAARPGGAPGAPRLLFAGRQDGRMVLGESFETGVPLMADLTPGTHDGLALLVTDWLIGLARLAPSRTADWRRRLVDAPVDEFAVRYGDVADDGALAATRARLAGLGDLPGAFEQRDCSPWNVLRRPDGGLVVLDWESAEPRGLPVLDLVYYLTFAGLYLARAIDGGRAAAYRTLRDPATPAGRVTAECERRYLGALHLAPRCLHPLRLLAWVVHSRAEFDRLRVDRGGSPTTDDLRRATFLELWREELRLGGDG